MNDAPTSPFPPFVWPDLEGDALIEQAFRDHGVRVGGVLYLNADPEFLARAKARESVGIPLPGIDDERLESDLLFAMLSPERKARVQAAANFREKRLALLQAAQEQTGIGEGDETRCAPPQA